MNLPILIKPIYNTLHPCNLTLHTFETQMSFKRYFCYGLNSAPKEYVLPGNFSINAPAVAILEVSFVGFSTLEVPVNGQDNLTITLATDNELDEVIVTGYGSQKKKGITSAVAVFRLVDSE